MDLNSLSLRISRTENFTVQPTVLVQILRLYEDPFVSPRSLEKIIEQDPALTAKVLRVATSSAYGAKSGLSVGRALSVLGINTLRSIAISLAYQQILAGKIGGSGLERNLFGKHCQATAIGAKAIAKILAPQLMEEMYVAGLLHDVGILAIDRFCPLQLNVAIKKAQFNGISLEQAETEVLGYSHADVGGILAETWKLSPQVTSAIKYHFKPEQCPESETGALIVICANVLAYRCGIPEVSNISQGPKGENLPEALGLDEGQIVQLCETIMTELELADRAFSEAANPTLNEALVRR